MHPFHTHPYYRPLCRQVLLWCLLLCSPFGKLWAAPTDTAAFHAFIKKGNTAYAEKAGYSSLIKSLRYFDSAQAIAEQSRQVSLLAIAAAARGRVYDAWNREPQKTIALFAQASTLFRQAGEEQRALYYQLLLAHAYDKTGDSLRTTTLLRQMLGELKDRDTAFPHKNDFLSELVLIATQVRAYSLADSLLHHLTRRQWIVNDPGSYNFLDHYYLAQSRLDIHWRHLRETPYLDSLKAAYEKLTAPVEQMYYSRELANLYGTIGSWQKAYYYRNAQMALTDTLIAGGETENMQRSLIASETAGERRRLAYEKALSHNRTKTIWALSALLLIITVLSFYLFRRTKKYRAQSHYLQQVNGELDTQIAKVELLNKDIQHRVKNNLYTIYSLLHMQQESTENEEVIAHLETARLRVESVAALQEHLLADTEMVDFGGYIRTLSNKLVSCYADHRQLLMHLETAPVRLPVNTSLALSLILNEWMTNSIKYAHPPGELLNIDVRIIQNAKELCIYYADDGVLPANPTPKTGLGTDIIRLLTAQVKGKLQTVGSHPYHFNLCIPHEL